jgi:putative DNA primase/helicase
MTDRIDDMLEIGRLAALSLVEYEREREAAAEKLGVRTAILDRLVADARKDGSGKEQKGQGDKLIFPEIEPWGDRVDGVQLLDDLTALFSRFVVTGAAVKAAIALWVTHTYLYETALCTPRLVLHSSEKRSGKTTTLMLIEAVVLRPLFSASLSPAVLYRMVALAKPCVLIDEADHFADAPGRQELRALLNAGYSANGSALRLTGEDFEPRRFSCHCPVALALNGKLWDTLEDRSIRIMLKRRRMGETVERLTLAKLHQFGIFPRRLARWAADNSMAIAGAEPSIPVELHDRAADCWRILLAISDQCGGPWPQRARAAAVTLSADNEDTETTTTRLLRDLRELFEAAPSGVLFSSEIVTSLLAREEHGWAEMGRAGKPLSTIRLARLLHPFRIAPSTVRRGYDTAKGYERQQFEEVWERYL